MIQRPIVYYSRVLRCRCLKRGTETSVREEITVQDARLFDVDGVVRREALVGDPSELGLDGVLLGVPT
jgi:hypothetical protein